MIGTLLRLIPELVQNSYPAFISLATSTTAKFAYLSGHFMGLIIEQVSKVISSSLSFTRSTRQPFPLPSYWATGHSQICSPS